MEKKKLSQFSQNTEQSWPEGTNCNGPQAFRTVIMFVISSFSRTQEVDRQLFKETAVFPMKKIGILFLLLLSMADNEQKVIGPHKMF